MDTVIIYKKKVNYRSQQNEIPEIKKMFPEYRNMHSLVIQDVVHRVEHCFRTINTVDMAFPIYHWTPQKIKVRMVMSQFAYFFLALIYNRMRIAD